MGIDRDVAKFLLSAREQKVEFQKTLMLGYQELSLKKADYRHFDEIYDSNNLTRVATSTEFLHQIGAEEVSSMDISDYEGAEILHDLNQPIGEELKEKFDVVLDGGLLEHIFNFPVALANAMEMVAVGGHFVSIGGGNNFLGHGFYQFSPELFYRTLNGENGFAVKRLIAAEVGGKWYEVADPKKIKGRVELINDKPIYLMVLAEKIASRKPFEKTPQQSDYAALWKGENNAQKDQNSSNKIKNLLKRNKFLYKTLARFKQKQIDKNTLRERSFVNSKAYKLVEK